MARGRRWGRPRSNREGLFDPADTTRVKHTRIGIWDLYEETNPALDHVPGSSWFERTVEAYECLPYLVRMVSDVLAIRSCWIILISYATAEVLHSLIPAASLWYSGQLIHILQTAIDTRTVDADALFRISLARVACSVARRILSHALAELRGPLSRRLKAQFSLHLFRARARLDLPTFEDPLVQRQLEEASSTSGSIAYDTLMMASSIVSTLVQVVSQISVLAQVLGGQRDGILLAILSFATSISDWVTRWNAFTTEKVWAATTKDKDYIQMVGMKHVVNNMEHRKEFISGNLAEFMTKEFEEVSKRVGPDNAVDFSELRRATQSRQRLSIFSLLKDPIHELPQIVFTLRAVQYPASMPVSLASLNLLQNTTAHFAFTVWRFFDQTSSITEQLSTVRKLYEVTKISNRIQDGTKPFPEDAQKIKYGVALEFRNVSFRYPGSDMYALKNVSFKIAAGQLCVIVGANGSGKSTILKLVVRLYDPDEGQILLDGQDIRTLKLFDLRQAVSVLFQDYTHFPLSIRDNVALGDPTNFRNDERVTAALELGGASTFVARLPDGADTYLDRPVRDYFAGMPQGTTSLFGRPIDYSGVRSAGGMAARQGGPALSGGQMQRLAVARTFMRAVVAEEARVGLLLFDEPSASLDPTAEHDLFGRLRELRGNKTMVFSSHRFGSLTRHADLILYMNDSVIVEEGTHDELMQKQGEYARIWMLQAQAFL
ncbi:P-loop containing nucleoside triphosphate hydrolase protein [Epithele typhae]|uniref:P-loop containing nucleoside triphosphate hydrolase protein n=1 Tax=Epithele typhae TaxID=378194 RepID=UPI002007669F|nr:P-loop containing nucleoside triphosphate hydrolase protein [Epithele typhae]KAH9930399.1 P-loop containing nucleoside triphosphate hydrolase protein [Epithele typhae]